MSRNRLLSALLCLAFLALFSSSATAQATAAPHDPDRLQKLTQESSNPIGSLWMLTNQFNCNVLQSPKGHLFGEPRTQFNYNFQPVMTFDLSKDLRLITRPLLPVFNTPYAAGPHTVDDAFGLGDAEFLAMVSPVNDAKFLFGAGPTAVFPTATDKHLGDGKWQLGGALAAVYMDEKWVAGIFPQQWWSVGGEASRKEVSFTKAQYFLWYSPANTWQVGMSPEVLVDWTQKKAENALTLPVGLGVAKLVSLGKLPVKLSAEADYSVIRPRTAGTEWTFKLTITPIIPKLF
ncbi:MAG: hypothetical protein AAGU21_08130 [Solidesulfovibrio sp.]|uniref:hypothetical protein n=1 Tax=Solidesulfovibrio sp. TaxID=2910990 RepID=UPI002B1F34A1|nr:hypothetical protein [Solidesulfovibrio sp.]MEA4854789.1 hypothetical protein [Solidesulfovibrio sp.]